MRTKSMGWLTMKDRAKKKIDSKVPTVDFGVSLGELAITRGIVSRIEVREAKMGDPLEDESQYRRFWSDQYQY